MFSVFMLVALIVLSFGIPAGKVQAGVSSAYDLINGVNALRASNGLPPYTIDDGLMSVAQGHSEYQASIGQCTHTRADGSRPQDHGVSSENIACGINVSADYAIYTQWTDSLHWNTMVGISEGIVGAGVAQKDGWVYYTLDVRRTGSGSYPPSTSLPTLPGGTPAPTTKPGTPTSTLIPFNPLVTSTQNPDGSIIHVVMYYQTLETIARAYGVKVEDIQRLNNMALTDTAIYAGQKLLIQVAFTPTVSPTITHTPVPPTRTPTLTRTPRPPTLTPTLTQTLTRTPAPFLGIKLPVTGQTAPARHTLGLVIIGISILGLVVVAASFLFSGKKT